MEIMDMKKGQYFLLGGFILATLFYIGIYLAGTHTMISLSFASDDLKYLLYNIEDEYPRVLNFGIENSNISGRLADFTLRAKDDLSGNLISLSSLWLYTYNDSGILNVTIGNFLGNPENISINVSGTVKNASLADEGIGSETFSGIGDVFNISISFNSHEKKLSMVKDKYNIYSYIELRRAGEYIKGGVFA